MTSDDQGLRTDAVYLTAKRGYRSLRSRTGSKAPVMCDVMADDSRRSDLGVSFHSFRSGVVAPSCATDEREQAGRLR
jgi:hypothetical protein